MRKPWRHAEKHFELLCASYGAACNKADQDEHGWDYFVEFARRDNPKVPLDMVEPPPKCLIQIKSTRTKSTSTLLKLSNALEFAKLDAPCFNVMLIYHAGAQLPSHAVLHHFWEGEIRDTLRRARELDASGSRKAHKTRIRLPAKTGIRLSPNNLLEEILRTIEKIGSLYGDKKRLFASTLGFEETHSTGNLTYGAGVTIEDVVDLHIGLKDQLPISHFKMSSVRFGIESPATIADVGANGTVQVEPVARPCELVFSSDETGARAKLPANMFAPGIPGLPMENMKVRVTAPFADLTFSFSENKCNFRYEFGFEKPRELGELLTGVELLSVCNAPDMRIQLFVEGRELLNGYGPIENYPKRVTCSIRDAVSFLRHVCARDADVRTLSPPKATLSQVFDNLRRIKDYMACISDVNMIATASFDWQDGAKTGDAICYYFVTVPLGDIAVCTLVRRKGYICEPSDGRTPVKLGAGAIDFVRPRIISNDLTAYEQVMAAEIDRLSDATKDIPVLTFGDILKAA